MNLSTLLMSASALVGLLQVQGFVNNPLQARSQSKSEFDESIALMFELEVLIFEFYCHYSFDE